MTKPIARSLIALICLLLAATPSLAGGELKTWDHRPTPAFALNDVSGKPVRLEDFKGKVVLINFWATWCAPCIAELPSMQRLRDKLSLQGFEVLAVNYKESEKKIEEFLKKRPLNMTIPRDADGALGLAWGVRTFPTTFIIDTDSKIRYSVTGDVDWTSPSVESKIRELLPKT